MRIRKKGFEMSFGWMFAIIAGIVIIFLAIYFSSRFINFQQTAAGTETSKQIGILLNPLETSFESAQTTSFIVSPESRIYNICDDFGNFGTQTIQLAQKSFNQWTKTNVDVSFQNKYLFSDAQIEGKTFFIFSKPLNLPFKIADLIYLTSSNKVYCFNNAPSGIEEEINNLNQSNLLTQNCPTDRIDVCFNGNCDINVNYEGGSVSKDEDTLYFYSDALMYAAVFSDKDVYECQLKRLMKRTNELTSMYQGKLGIVLGECSSNLQNDLIQLSDYTKGYVSQSDIITIGTFSDELNIKNENPSCLLW